MVPFVAMIQGQCFLLKMITVVECSIKFFQRYPTYTFRAFLEVSLLNATISDYNIVSDWVAEECVIYSDWISFVLSMPTNVHAVLVSSGSREIWQAVLRRRGLHGDESRSMSEIAGNHASLHPYVVDDIAKALVVTKLRKQWSGCNTISFGNSCKEYMQLCLEAQLTFL